MFEEFWRQYPRKVAKKDALKAWSKLKPEQQQQALNTISLHVKHWADRDKEFIPHAASWLNGWRFEDELPQEVEKVRLQVVAKPVLPVEQQVPALAAQKSPKPEGLGELKNLVKRRY